MVWSPYILPMLLLQIYYTLWLLLYGEDPRIKVANDWGMSYSSSSYLVTEVTRPCVGRDPGRFSGRPARGVPMWQ